MQSSGLGDCIYLLLDHLPKMCVCVSVCVCYACLVCQIGELISVRGKGHSVATGFPGLYDKILNSVINLGFKTSITIPLYNLLS